MAGGKLFTLIGLIAECVTVTMMALGVVYIQGYNTLEFIQKYDDLSLSFFMCLVSGCFAIGMGYGLYHYVKRSIRFYRNS